jgi:hypothetical protein
MTVSSSDALTTAVLEFGSRQGTNQEGDTVKEPAYQNRNEAQQNDGQLKVAEEVQGC